MVVEVLDEEVEVAVVEVGEGDAAQGGDEDAGKGQEDNVEEKEAPYVDVAQAVPVDVEDSLGASAESETPAVVEESKDNQKSTPQVVEPAKTRTDDAVEVCVCLFSHGTCLLISNNFFRRLSLEHYPRLQQSRNQLSRCPTMARGAL